MLETRYSKLLSSSITTNTDQDLYFFPVDNTSSDPADVKTFQKLTSLTEAKISSDKLPPLLSSSSSTPLPYIDDKVPISWLNFFDELRKLGAEKDDDEEESEMEESNPYLETGLVPTSDNPTVTAFTLAREHKVFEGLSTEEEKKTRLEVVLNSLHELGLVIFFNSSTSLKAYVILQPQWLMDQVCFVIRDFKRHRLRRDKRIQKKMLDEWLNLTDSGIASSRILGELWVGLEGGQVKFLISLMNKLGLLVPFNETTASSSRYFAPNLVTTEDDDDDDHDDGDDGDDDVDDDDNDNNDEGGEEIPSGTETFNIESYMDGARYRPNGFLERLIAECVPYATNYTSENPSISIDFPLPSEVHAKGKIMVKIEVQDGDKVALISLSSNGKEIVCSITPLGEGSLDWKHHAQHLMESAGDVNDEFFEGRLSMLSSRRDEVGEIGNKTTKRSLNVMTQQESVRIEKDEEGVEVEKDDDEESVFIFLKECGIKDNKALPIADKLEDDGYDEVQTLMDLLEDSVEDFKEALGEAGEMMVGKA